MCDCCAEHMRNSLRTLCIENISTLDSFGEIEKILSSHPGVLMSEFLPDLGQARITFDCRVTSPDGIHDEIRRTGYNLL